MNRKRSLPSSKTLGLAIVTLLALVVGTSGQGEIGPQRWKSLTHAPTTGTTARLALQVAEFRCTRP